MGISRRSILKAGAGLAATAATPGVPAAAAASALSPSAAPIAQTMAGLMQSPFWTTIQTVMVRAVMENMLKNSDSSREHGLIYHLESVCNYLDMDYCDDEMEFTSEQLIKSLKGEIPPLREESGSFYFSSSLSVVDHFDCLPQYLKVGDLLSPNNRSLFDDEEFEMVQRLAAHMVTLAGPDASVADVRLTMDSFFVRVGKAVIENGRTDGNNWVWLNYLAEYVEGLGGNENQAMAEKILEIYKRGRAESSRRQSEKEQAKEDLSLRQPAEPDLRKPYSCKVSRLSAGEYLLENDSYKTKRPITRMELMQLWQQLECQATLKGEYLPAMHPRECRVEMINDKLCRAWVGPNRLREAIDAAIQSYGYGHLKLPNRMQELYRE